MGEDVGYGIAFVVICLFVFRTFVIDSGSMENTLLVGDYLVVNQMAIGGRIPFTELSIPGYADTRHGDIVVLYRSRFPGQVDGLDLDIRPPFC